MTALPFEVQIRYQCVGATRDPCNGQLHHRGLRLPSLGSLGSRLFVNGTASGGISIGSRRWKPGSWPFAQLHAVPAAVPVVVQPRNGAGTTEVLEVSRRPRPSNEDFCKGLKTVKQRPSSLFILKPSNLFESSGMPRICSPTN